MEKRTFKIEFRNEPESRMVEGYAAMYDVYSKDLGNFIETIKPGAFNNTDITETKALFNHDYNYPLASYSNNSLQIEFDEVGIKYRFEMPNTSYGDDLLELMKNGLIYQSSFAFTVNPEKTQWTKTDGKNVRNIYEIDTLYDVSIVTNPAYEDTSVAIKRYQDFVNQKPVKKADWINSYFKILNLGNNDN